MPFFVYIIQSQLDDSLYIGQTNDLEGRILRHNQGRSSYTKTKRPWVLLHHECFECRSSAVKRESYLKGLHSRKAILNIIGSAG